MIGRSSIIRENKKIGEFFSISAGKYITQSRFGRKIKVRFRAAYLEKRLIGVKRLLGKGFAASCQPQPYRKAGPTRCFYYAFLPIVSG
jgi:hypothetical protein